MAKVNYSTAIEELHGEVGEDVFVRTRSGSVLRGKPTYTFPVSPNQAVTVDYFKQAQAAFKALTRAQYLAWNAFAATQIRHNEATGRRYAPTGQNVFMGLTCKFLQINPGATPPMLPPAGSFAGDKILLNVTTLGDTLFFTANGPNTGTTQTELLLQKLKTAHRAPTDKYVSQAFVTYYPHGLTASLEVDSGLYIPAYRFVNAATGQMTNLQVLPEVVVP